MSYSINVHVKNEFSFGFHSHMYLGTHLKIVFLSIRKGRTLHCLIKQSFLQHLFGLEVVNLVFRMRTHITTSLSCL